MEFAGSASSSPSSSGFSAPSQLAPDVLWLADTGATSHMTPHRHWLRSYAPFRVPIRLADSTIVYSAGVGSVVFQPVVDGKLARPVEFSRVLHVPALRNNLLACLLACILAYILAFLADLEVTKSSVYPMQRCNCGHRLKSILRKTSADRLFIAANIVLAVERVWMFRYAPHSGRQSTLF